MSGCVGSVGSVRLAVVVRIEIAGEEGGGVDSDS